MKNVKQENEGDEARPLFFVDMDGVLVDWVGGLIELFPKEAESAGLVHMGPGCVLGWPEGEWDIRAVLKINQERIDYRMRSRGVEWWANLDPLPGYRWLLDQLAMLGDWFILSAPKSNDGGLSCMGKQMWMDRHLGTGFDRFILTEHKHHLACTGGVIIDDMQYNIDAWQAKAGRAVLYPQPWNKGLPDNAMKVSAVLDQAAAFYGLEIEG